MAKVSYVPPVEDREDALKREAMAYKALKLQVSVSELEAEAKRLAAIDPIAARERVEKADAALRAEQASMEDSGLVPGWGLPGRTILSPTPQSDSRDGFRVRTMGPAKRHTGLSNGRIPASAKMQPKADAPTEPDRRSACTKAREMLENMDSRELSFARFLATGIAREPRPFNRVECDILTDLLRSEGIRSRNAGAISHAVLCEKWIRILRTYRNGPGRIGNARGMEDFNSAKLNAGVKSVKRHDDHRYSVKFF